VASPQKTYVGRRLADLGDCFQASVGYGLMTYARFKFTDWMVAGMGVAAYERYGCRGRYGDRGWEKQRSGDPYIGDVHYAAGLPLIANEEGSDGAGNRVSTLGPGITTRRYAKDLEPADWRGKLADRFWISLTATAALSFELGINIAELLDFLIGLTSLDMLGDDDWTPKPLPPQKPPPDAK